MTWTNSHIMGCFHWWKRLVGTRKGTRKKNRRSDTYDSYNWHYLHGHAFTHSLSQARSPVQKSQSPTPFTLEQSRESKASKYHTQVIQNIVEFERQFTNELQTLLSKYLRPLESSNILTPMEYSILCSNLEEIYSFQQSLLREVEEFASGDRQQRVGACYMKGAPQLQTLYTAYCSNHPKTVTVINAEDLSEKLDKFMENQGAPSPGRMTLTASLSMPFRRLDKYPSILSELEKHTEEGHPDWQDVRAAIQIYRNIVTICLEVRKQKDMEHEILTGAIRQWEGEDISCLGDIVKMSQVTVIGEEKKERYLLLFPSVLVMLSVSPRMSGFVYQGKIPLSGIRVNLQEDTDEYYHAFEITGNFIEKILVQTNSPKEQKEWNEAIQKCIKSSPMQSQHSSGQVSQRSTSSTDSRSSASPTRHASLPEHLRPKTWSISCLRPSPPLRPTTVLMIKDEAQKSPKMARKMLHSGKRKQERVKVEEEPSRRNDAKSLHDDALILKVIEAYCTSATGKGHMSVHMVDEVPQVIIAEEEKIIVEETKGNQTIVEEKSLVDTVYALKDQVKELTEESKRLKRGLEDEVKARKKLETLIRKNKTLKSLFDPSVEVNLDDTHL
uniref:Rho guanine nucleotide exchange factor 7-like isoform X2 n=1 Tax=Saccoglossus kowalevskii TaxID=10224 RepID=A0ABM0MGK4_SACKO|nr:PREDICTED: rho guanine nucleotide exchange factor 7-like isoform X2 [Saccoglossus kowalevskii]